MGLVATDVLAVGRGSVERADEAVASVIDHGVGRVVAAPKSGAHVLVEDAAAGASVEIARARSIKVEVAAASVHLLRA